jgi:hypothetical protein
MHRADKTSIIKLAKCKMWRHGKQRQKHQKNGGTYFVSHGTEAKR